MACKDIKNKDFFFFSLTKKVCITNKRVRYFNVNYIPHSRDLLYDFKLG